MAQASEKIEQAFLSLIAEKSFRYITVRNIIERAMVNRSTFYAHFLDKYDLRDRLVERACLDLERSIPIAFLEADAPDTKAIAASIREIHRKRDWFQTILHEHMEIDAERKFSAVIEKYILAWAEKKPGNYPAELFAKLYAASCLATILWSLEHGSWREEDVAQLIAWHTQKGFFKEYFS